MRTCAVTLATLLSIGLVTGGCQVVGLLPFYLGVEQSDIGPPATEASLCIELRTVPQEGQPIDGTVMDQVQAVVGARVGATGIADPTVGRDGDRITVWLPGVEAGSEVLDALSGLLTARGVVVLLPVPEARLGTLVDGQPVPNDMATLPPIVDGEGVVSARVHVDEQSGGPLLAVELSAAAATEFDEYAAAHFGEQVAIVVDGVVAAAPILQAADFDGQIEISLPTAPATDRDPLDQLATVLRYGPLPLPLELVSAGPCG